MNTKPKLNVLFGQINTTPGDFEGNYSKIIKALCESCTDTQLHFAVFPELSIPGYLCKDLVYENGFIEQNLIYLNKICHYSSITPQLTNTVIVVGYFDRNKTGVGKPFTNMLAVIKNGLIIGTYQKHLLPFYDIFDENRYCEPGKDLLILKEHGRKIGFTICEDIWNCKDVDNYNYEDNPISSYVKRDIDLMINISSSPYVAGKPQRRFVMLNKVKQFDLIYVNQFGGQDDLVFDGNSCFISNTWPNVHMLGAEEKFETLDINSEYPNTTFIDDCNDIAMMTKMITTSLRDYVHKSGFKQIVLGSSGGIDSAVVAALATLALGPENVHCIMMPSIHSSEGSVTDAKELHKNLGCKEYLVPIDHEPLLNSVNLTTNLKDNTYNPVADENIQARMRGMIVMHFSNASGALALTTGNKTELATGYCTLYGDTNGGFAPINDLYKLQVFAVARHINKICKRTVIPLSIINKAPSAELSPNQTDEASLLPYNILDQIVKQYIEKYINSFTGFKNSQIPQDVVDWCNLASNVESKYNRIIRLIKNCEFKRRQMAPGVKLSTVAFGTGRRMPIVKKF